MLWITFGTLLFRFLQPRLRDWEPFQRNVQPHLDRSPTYLRVRDSCVGRRMCVVRSAVGALSA